MKISWSVALVSCWAAVCEGGVGAETWRLPPLLLSTVPRRGRRMLPVLDIQLLGELKCIEMDRLARFEGVESVELEGSDPLASGGASLGSLLACAGSAFVLGLLASLSGICMPVIQWALVR